MSSKLRKEGLLKKEKKKDKSRVLFKVKLASWMNK